MLAGLYAVRCHVFCLPCHCSILLRGENKHRKHLMRTVSERSGTGSRMDHPLTVGAVSWVGVSRDTAPTISG